MLSLRRKMQFWEAHAGLARWCSRKMHAPLVPLYWFYVKPKGWFFSVSRICVGVSRLALSETTWSIPRTTLHKYFVLHNDFLISVEKKFLFLLHVWPFSFCDSVCNSISSINIFRSWLLAIVNHYYYSKIWSHHICDHDPLSVSLLNANSYFVCIAISRLHLFFAIKLIFSKLEENGAFLTADSCSANQNM